MFHFFRRLGAASIIIILLALGSALSYAADDDPLTITTERISPRVLILRSGSAYTDQVVAIATEKGLVVVDTTYMPSMAKRFRAIIEKEFGRKDFVYVINTHFHPDHTFGNAVFPEAKVIAHATTKSDMLKDFGDKATYLGKMKSNLADQQATLDALEPGAARYPFSKQSVALYTRIVEDLSGDFVLRTPDIEFVGEMNLDMGDVNINLRKFGKNQHTTSDIFIYIPEEQVLITGDLFAKEWLPEVSSNESVAEQIALFDETHNYYASAKVIIPGHYGNYEPDYFIMSRDYYAKLYSAVKGLREQGKSLEEIKQELDFKTAFPEIAHMWTDFFGYDFHLANIETVWNELEGSE